MMMLFGGFGFLMTFLKKYGLSAIGFTMIITVLVSQFSLIIFGLLKMTDNGFSIKMGFIDLVIKLNKYIQQIYFLEFMIL